jgi:hypothetical protein
MSNSERIINEFKDVQAKENIPDKETYEKNLKAFLIQCPNDGILTESHLNWYEEEHELEVLWDTSNLEVRFSIGIEEARWNIWIGVNHHKEDDVRYNWGVGGDDIDEKCCFADVFFDFMNHYWNAHREYWTPYLG